MESSILGVILDSSIMIDAERQKLDVARFLKHITPKIGNLKAALSVISVAELAHGVHRANTRNASGAAGLFSTI